VAAASDADLTVRVANIPPSTDPSWTEVNVRTLLREHARIGGLVRVSVPLDVSKERDAPSVATRAFLRFDSIERAMRAEAALSKLSLSGAKLVASRLGKREPPATPAGTPTVKREYYEHAFPELPEPAPAVTIDERCVKLLDKLAPRPSGTPSSAASEDGHESLLSVASTETAQSVCSYCKGAGHAARRHGLVCCPVLKLKLERDAETEAAKAADRAMDRQLERKLRQHEAELTGWTTVGKAHSPTAPVAAATLPSVEEHGVVVEDAKTADLSRTQKRMQKRREKSRAKRAEGWAQ